MSNDDDILCSKSSKPIKLELIDDLKIASIVTVKKGIEDNKIRKELNEKYDAQLVDMEAFHIADFAKQKKMSCRIIKMVSDHADEMTTQTFKKSLQKFNKEVAKIFQKIITY